MVPESHEISFPSSPDLHDYLMSGEFRGDILQKLKDQYVVELVLQQPKTEQVEGTDVMVETLLLTYTRNNAGGLKDAIDFLILGLVTHGLDANDVKGAIPRPKSDSFEDSMPYFDSKLLQRAEPPVSTESPTRSGFGTETNSDHRSFLDKLRKPSSISSFSAFLERRKNGSNSPSSLFKHASNNASKASLVSLESRESGYRNPWNDSGIDLEHDNAHTNGWASLAAAGSRPATSSASLTSSTPYESKFPFGAVGNASTTSLNNTPMIPGLGDIGSADAASTTNIRSDGNATPVNGYANHGAVGSRPSSSAASGYPAPIGPPR